MCTADVPVDRSRDRIHHAAVHPQRRAGGRRSLRRAHVHDHVRDFLSGCRPLDDRAAAVRVHEIDADLFDRFALRLRGLFHHRAKAV